MTDVEFRLTADVGQATKGISGFRKEFADMVKAVEKPLGQISVLQQSQESAKKAAAEFFAAKRNVDQLRDAFQQAGQPVKGLSSELNKAERTLARTTLEFDRQKAKVREQRTELRAAGVDTRNLAGEQQRLQAEIAKGVAAGNADVAMRSAKDSFGVGAIEDTQRSLVDLRRQYQLVAADATLTGKQRAEAEASYRRKVSETLEELRKLRAGVRANATQAEAAAAAERGRYASAREGIRAQAAALAQVTREQRQANIEAARGDLGVNRYRVLQSELARTQSQYALLRRVGGLTNKELAVAQLAYTRRVKETQMAMRQLVAEQQRQRTGSVGLTGAVGGIGAAYIAVNTIKSIAQTADAYSLMNARLKLATDSQQEFNVAQSELRRIATETQTPVASLVTLYGRISRPLKEAGRSQADILKLTEAVATSFRVSGATATEAENGVIQFAQALGAGALRGEEFNSVAEQAPRLMQALATSLGVPIGALKEMATQGLLTADVVTDAMVGQLDVLRREAEALPETVGGAMTALSDRWNEAVGQADVQPLIDAINGLGDTLSDPVVIDNLVKLASALATLAGTAVDGASEFVELGKRIAFIAANSQGLVTELDKVDQQIVDLDRSLKGAGLNTTIDGLLFSKEELQAKRDALAAFRAAIVQEQTGMNAELEFLAEVAAGAAEFARQQEVDAYSKYIGELKKLQGEQVKAAEKGAKALVGAERKATAELKKVRDERVKIEERYKEALAGLGGDGAASYGNAQALKVGAREALAAGDVEGAQAQAQAALKMLQELAAAGENTYGFAGFIGELQAIELAANDIEQTNAEAKIKSIQDSMEALKDGAKKLQDMPVSIKADEASIEAVRTQLQALISELGNTEIVVPVRVAHPDGPIIQDLPPEPGFAAGGWTGPGSKYQAAGVVHADEHVQPKRVVNEPGALPFLEQIRRQGFRNTMSRLGMPGYADGGLVLPSRAMPSIPQISPSLMAGSDPLKDWGKATLSGPDGSYEVLMRKPAFEQILSRTAMKHGRTHK